MREDFGGTVGTTAAESTPWWAPRPTPPDGAPNVVVVVLDDTGFAHLGCFGSDIETPNIDRLAAGGLRFTNFHTTALCSPTRASLLSGRNHHSVGMRFLSNTDTGFSNCRGVISPRAGTLAEVLQANGYATFALGKWHLANMEDCSPSGPMTHWPLGRGFDRFYGFLGGATDQFSPELVVDNHVEEQPSDPDHHLSEAMVDQAISMITSHRATSQRPFFTYLAFGATHAPHQAPRSFIDKYRGRYDRGWDVVRAEWFARQQALGIVPADAELSPRNWDVQPWDELSDDQRTLFARMQEVFAAFLDHTDVQIGRFVDFLTELGELDDTLIVLLSDNGASQEGGTDGVVNELTHFNGLHVGADEMMPFLDLLGGPHLFNNYPKGWAQAGNTPLRFYKQNTFEGGIRDPLIVHWPRRIGDAGGIRTQYHHAIDVMPTILDAVGITPPTELKGQPQLPIEGTSTTYCWDDAAAPSRRTTQYYEMLGHRAIYHEGWKAVTLHFPRTPYDQERWNLYHVDRDFAEIHDLADELPDKVAEMSAIWWQQAERYGVLPLDDRTIELFAIRRPGSELARNSFTFRQGAARIDRFAMPDLRNRSWSIAGSFPVSDGVLPEGVLVAGGDRTSGYTLYLHDGAAHFAFNYLGEVRTVSTPITPADLRGGTVTATARFAKTEPYQGIVTVEVNGVAGGSGPLRMLPFRQTVSGLHVGADPGSTVTDAYPAPFRFTGHGLVVRYQMLDDRDDLRRAAEMDARNAIAEQ
ncbi:MAG: arylsulfatase [Acidimicrobiales bacterium]